MFDRIYTGRIVPEGMGGASVDQSRTPQPNIREQEFSEKLKRMKMINPYGPVKPLYRMGLLYRSEGGL
jgi:hypothetical protein